MLGRPCSDDPDRAEPPTWSTEQTLYLAVKQAFDKLNYGTNSGALYDFNPWVAFIHDPDYLNAPNVYAYSVDDAVGNVQAEGLGFIIDIASTQNLENPLPAIPPINISLGYAGSPVEFASHRVCTNDPARDKPVNPHFPSFVISANNPKNCPVYLLDNKDPPQSYTFTVTQPPPFTAFQNPADAHWSEQTAGIIDCSGNTDTAPFYPSSKLWCCEKLAGDSGNGVFAYTTPDPTSVHLLNGNFVITIKAEEKYERGGTSCN